jgi:hypothetical protein
MHERTLTVKDKRLIRAVSDIYHTVEMQDDTDTGEIIEYPVEPTATDADY